MNQKGISSSLIILIIVGVLIVGGGYYAIKKFQKPVVQVCTQEAKLCPDGSYVGRTGPNCEFAACPEVKDETANWKTYRNEEYGFEVKYPKEYDQNIRCKLGMTYFEERLVGISLAEGYNFGISPKTGDDLSEKVNNFIKENIEKQDGKVVSKESINFGNYKGIKVAYHDKWGMYVEDIFVIKGNWLFTMNLYDDPQIHFCADLINQGFTSKDVFNQILSTFKFISQ